MPSKGLKYIKLNARFRERVQHGPDRGRNRRMLRLEPDGGAFERLAVLGRRDLRLAFGLQRALDVCKRSLEQGPVLGRQPSSLTQFVVQPAQRLLQFAHRFTRTGPRSV